MVGRQGIIRCGWVALRRGRLSMRRRHLRATTAAVINTRLVALTWIIEPILKGLIDRKRTTERIVLVLITRAQTIERIIPLLSTRAGIILGREARLLSTLPRIIRCNRIQHHLRTRLPNMQPRSMRHMKVVALSRLTMSTTRSRLTKQQAARNIPRAGMANLTSSRGVPAVIPMRRTQSLVIDSRRSSGENSGQAEFPWNGRRWPPRKIRWEP
jgi:hypothetical protein